MWSSKEFIIESEVIDEIDQDIREVNGAIVMDPLAIGIKTAELMVALERTGIRRYRSGAWATPAAELRTLLAKEFDS